jgi:rhomboid protease GluP
VYTRILIGINVVVYLWELATGALDSDQALIRAGAMYGPLMAQGQWWRIVSGSFLHGGFLHILFNMIALWQVGTFTENVFGPGRMLLLYAISMLGGGWAIYHFTYGEITVGASGAIFGIFGSLTAAGMMLGKRGRPLVTSNIGIIVLNLLIGFMAPNHISNAGHIGGLVCGFVAGFLFMPRRLLRQAPVVVRQPDDPNTIEGEVLYDSARDEPQPEPEPKQPQP